MRAAPTDPKKALADWGMPWRPTCPQRLSDETRVLAHRSLSGEYGRAMTTATFHFSADEAVGLSPEMRYARICILVAEKALLRILPGERIVGSATLLEAPRHQIPTLGESSVSHTTIGFHRALKTGYRGLRKQIAQRIARGGLDARGVDLLNAMTLCMDAADVWHKRHMDALADLAAHSTGAERANYLRTRAALANVPENPPRSFHEAVQSLWFLFEFQRLMGNWSGLGRVDEMLGPYLKRDLAAGKLTLDEAREILAHFWVHGTEWAGIQRGSGDAQHYQNVILAGVDAAGREVTNEVTYLVLDIVEELHISDFPIAVRINKRSPEKLLQRVAEVQRHGGGIVALYNEDVVIDGLVKFGYPLEEARTFTNDGCWEVLIPGKTTFIYSPFDMLALLQDAITPASKPAPEYADFEALYSAFHDRLATHLDEHNRMADGWCKGGAAPPLISLLVDDCIERGRGYYDRGSHYTVLAPHAGGMADVANSLLVMKKLVFEDGILSLRELSEILRGDWQGQEYLRQKVRSRFAFYGNDDQAADAMMQRVFDDYATLCERVREREGVLRPAGISTFGRQIEWTAQRLATASGHHRGEYLASNCSPTPGTDTKGPTAVLRSYGKLDFTRTPNGATLELKIDPASVRGQRGVAALVGIMRGFVDLRGWYLHVDVVDTQMLLDAQAHPERYPNLSVRIAGWSARFATLDKTWQDMVIQRTMQHVS